MKIKKIFTGLRNAYSEPETQYLILVFAFLLFQRDLSTRNISETFLVDYFITAVIFSKVYEFLLKVCVILGIRTFNIIMKYFKIGIYRKLNLFVIST
jgi:hypothetical protein